LSQWRQLSTLDNTPRQPSGYSSHNFLLFQFSNLILTKAELDQNFIGELTKFRRAPP
jgi:hypothetical protein